MRKNIVTPINEVSLSFDGEDHTILNPLVFFINMFDKNVMFSSYTIPHPSEKNAIFSIQTTDPEQQKIDNIKKSLKNSCVLFVTVLDDMLSKIDRA